MFLSYIKWLPKYQNFILPWKIKFTSVVCKDNVFDSKSYKYNPYLT